MINKKKLMILIVIMLFAVGGITGCVLNQVEANSEDYSERFQKMFLIYDLVRGNYVEEVDTDTLLEGSIKGMLESLEDPYTSYLTPQQFEDMQSDMEGEYGGIGIIITQRDEQLTIVSPMDKTPGDRAGLQAGDMIVGIDGTSTKGMVMQKAVGMMKGEPGTDVTLKIKRVDEATEESKEFEVEIIRELIELEYVRHEMLENDIGYIQFSRFGNDVAEDIANSLAQLKEEGAKGFILDVRNNPGGLLTEATKVVGNFIDSGPAVYIKERSGDKTPMMIERGIDTVDEPLVIISNRGSASGSEILIGAIQDENRGTVVGGRTFGKGVVQNVVPLSDGSAVRLTVAHYYTPEGRLIDPDKGLAPDIEVELDLENEEDEQLNKAIEVLNDKLK